MLLGQCVEDPRFERVVGDEQVDVTEVDFSSGVEQLKQRLELLLGSKPSAPLEQRAHNRATEEVERFGAHRERVAQAGGELLGAVFHFLGELVSEESKSPSEAVVGSVRERLEQCVEPDERGRPRLTFTLPAQKSLEGLAQTLAGLLVPGDKSR